MKFCRFPGCGKKRICHDLCAAHNRQYQAGGMLKPLQVQYHGLTEAERLMRRVDKRERNECWPWIGKGLVKGYGQFKARSGLPEPASRAAWRLFVGPIPENTNICHRCDNPLCCNPAHLFLGSQSENVKDMWAKGRARPGISYGERHGMAKLTVDDVKAIRASVEAGTVLAKQYKVSPTTICDVRKRRIWNQIP